MPRTILIHLNLELPDDSPAFTVDEIQDTIEGALEVGLEDHGHIPTPTVALCEEV